MKLRLVTNSTLSSLQGPARNWCWITLAFMSYVHINDGFDYEKHSYYSFWY